LDKENKSAISFALIYFNGTFVGTYSDQNGNFKLDISNNISKPLTISAIGYYSYTLNNISNGKQLIILLIPKVTELEEVVVTANSLVKERKENLKIFKNIFLGTTVNASDCIITNENDITFNYGKDEDTLKAFASKPIIINNMALGYKMIYYLDKFVYYRKSAIFFYQGSILFKEDLTSDDSQEKFYERKRKSAYLGSRMHFFRALWENDLQSNGFIVRNSLGEILDNTKFIIEDSNNRKFLKYRGKLNVCFKLAPTNNILLPESNIVILKDHVYFDKNGYFDPLGINWEGEMATRGTADWLPYEYTIETNRLLPVGMHLPGNTVFAQQKSCVVKMESISGAYSGSCKNGLAHGKGIAQGIDHYEGQFRKGFPYGNGTYIWLDGTYYTGQWRNGMREGNGQMVSIDSTANRIWKNGIWKDDVFLVKKDIPLYKIIQKRSVTNYSIRKVSYTNNNISIRLFRAGVENADMGGLSLYYSSGEEYHSSSYVGIQNPTFPIDIKVKFSALNYFHTASHDVIFEFTINEPGTWEVAIAY